MLQQNKLECLSLTSILDLVYFYQPVREPSKVEHLWLSLLVKVQMLDTVEKQGQTL
jgi:hypothetical protein